MLVEQGLVKQGTAEVAGGRDRDQMRQSNQVRARSDSVVAPVLAAGGTNAGTTSDYRFNLATDLWCSTHVLLPHEGTNLTRAIIARHVLNPWQAGDAAF